MICFDVQLEVFCEVITLQKGIAGGSIRVILMLSGLLGFRFDIEGTVESDLLLVIYSHLQELPKMVHLASHVGVEQRLVAFTATPENVACSAKLQRDLHRLRHLRRSVGKYVSVAGGGCSVEKARIREKIG